MPSGQVTKAIYPWLPIRKLGVGLVGYGLTWGALRLGLDLGSDGANQAAGGVIAFAFAYAEKDRRVSHVLDEANAAVVKAETYGKG